MNFFKARLIVENTLNELQKNGVLDALTGGKNSLAFKRLADGWAFDKTVIDELITRIEELTNRVEELEFKIRANEEDI